MKMVTQYLLDPLCCQVYVPNETLQGEKNTSIDWALMESALPDLYTKHLSGHYYSYNVHTMVRSMYQDNPEFPAKDHHLQKLNPSGSYTTTTTITRTLTYNYLFLFRDDLETSLYFMLQKRKGHGEAITLQSKVIGTLDTLWNTKPPPFRILLHSPKHEDYYYGITNSFKIK